VDPASRGARFDEAIVVCRRLWSEETITHEGPHFPFAEVAFEPKPPQGPIPILVGGESARALRRAAWLGDGWIGMGHTPETAATTVATLREQRAEAGRLDQRFEVVVGGSCTSEDDVVAWEEAGVDCLLVTPWNRTAEVFDAMASFAQRFLA
jgi:alkanesulfonate monooxygenase SsuD/methylene tetrahydromethanopterin reductase-like flavin-dependent oxidoreductase (luciferase family)